MRVLSFYRPQVPASGLPAPEDTMRMSAPGLQASTRDEMDALVKRSWKWRAMASA